jgi:predicted lactoylglutathione lyase
MTEPYFATYTTKPVADATATTEAIVALAVEERNQVDELVGRAVAAGGAAGGVKDQGFLYQRGFQDPDGHL